MIALGMIDPTDYARRLLRDIGMSPAVLLTRHARGEPSDISTDDIGWKSEGTEIRTSIYRISSGDYIWLTTYDTDEELGLTTSLV